jgi:cytochrome b561
VQSSPSDRYTRTAVVFHWLIAALVIANLILAWIFHTVPDEEAQPYTNAHKTIGITVLGLALLRLLWRFAHRPPSLSPAIPRWQVTASRTSHFLLYFMIFAMPLSGWIYDSAWEWASSYPISVFGWFDMPRIGWVVDMAPEPKKALDELAGKIHVWLSYLLYVLLAAHLTGAAKHQWFDRIPTLERMTFRGPTRN